MQKTAVARWCRMVCDGAGVLSKCAAVRVTHAAADAEEFASRATDAVFI